MSKELQKSNVVQLSPTIRRPALSMPLDKLDSFHGRRAIAKLVRDWLRSKDENGKMRTINALALKANLHRATVSNIADETTKWPRLHTILAILAGIGFTAVRFE